MLCWLDSGVDFEVHKFTRGWGWGGVITVRRETELHVLCIALWMLKSESAHHWSAPFSFLSSTHPHCSSRASCGWCHIPLDQTQCQQHHWRWTHHPERGRVPHHVRELGRDACSGRCHLQTVAPGSRCGVWDQSPAVQTWGGWDGTTRPVTDHQDQMCWWVYSFNPQPACLPLP